MRDSKLADDPADTRMMAIVHSALKRDLVRAREVLAGQSPRWERSGWRSVAT